MEIVCKKITPYKCNVCKEEMLFFYTDNGTLIDYKELFNRGLTIYELRNYLQYKHVRYIKCITCNKLYIIDWSKGFPVPLIHDYCLKKFGIV